ncbi:hypothetical protein K8I28_06070 [bacterium]|nr:hypothetical protein [bacterium]
MKILVFLFALLLVVNVASAQSESTFRSLAVPGWGQFYNEQPLKGWIFFAGEAAAISSWLIADQMYEDSYEDYLLAKTPNKAAKLYDDVQQARLIKNVTLASAGGVWVLNVLDAWLFSKDREGSLFGFGIQQDDSAVSFQVKVNFSLGGK